MNNRHPMTRTMNQKSRRRKRRRKTIFLIFLLMITTSVLILFDMFNQASGTLKESYADAGRDNGSELREQAVTIDQDNFSILLIGVANGGSRGTDFNGLSDALLLATFNKEEKSVKLLSIPRDTYVYLPLADQYTKINHAHSYDGTKGSIAAVEHTFEIPIDYYAKVNFDAFIDVVDALDGITFDVPYEMSEIDSNDRQNVINLSPGIQKLNGEEALAVARTRRYDNDIERGKRQQEILQAIFDRATSLSVFTNFSDVLSAVGKNLTTDIRFEEIRHLVTYLTDPDFEIEMLNLEGYDMRKDGVYYYDLDDTSLANTKLELQNHLEFNKEEEKEEEEESDQLPD